MRFIVVFLWLLFSLWEPVAARTIRVSEKESEHGYFALYMALLEAAPNDTLLVAAGLYEGGGIDKPLTLIGAGADSTIVEGPFTGLADYGLSGAVLSGGAAAFGGGGLVGGAGGLVGAGHDAWGLTNDTAYAFEVVAENRVGRGERAEASATPQATSRAATCTLTGPATPTVAENAAGRAGSADKRLGGLHRWRI